MIKTILSAVMLLVGVSAFGQDCGCDVSYTYVKDRAEKSIAENTAIRNNPDLPREQRAEAYSLALASKRELEQARTTYRRCKRQCVKASNVMGADEVRLNDLRKAKHTTQIVGVAIAGIGAATLAPAALTLGSITLTASWIVGMVHDNQQDKLILKK